jgi:hypothetical protein
MAVVINEIEVTQEAKSASAAAQECSKRDLPEEFVARELEKVGRRAYARTARLMAD